MNSIDIWSSKNPPSKDVTAFIKISPPASQPKLRQLRRIIKKAVPTAEEGISYRMPVYKYKGKGFVGFAGYQHHIGLYPMSGSFLKIFKKELANYKTSKGAIQFPLNKPLPVTFIKKLLKTRLAEIK